MPVAARSARKDQHAALLVELLVEELPPRLLAGLADQFADALLTGLRSAGFTDQDASVQPYATPRRLAAVIDACAPSVPARMETVHGPAIAACYGPDGTPTRALLGFAAAHGVDPASLKRAERNGREHAALVKRVPALRLAAALGQIVEDAIGSVSAPRMMRWGQGERRFVRPLRGLLAVHGSSALRITAAGIASGKTTPGHRARCRKALPVSSAARYAAILRKNHKVVADLPERCEQIEQQLAAAAGSELKVTSDPNLVAETAAMSENPQVYAASFDQRFLALPPEAIVSCLRAHMRCFVLRKRNKLAPKFLLVADNRPASPALIIAGFERVVAARLADAEFYWQEDYREVAQPAYRAKLTRLTYHAKLGSVADRIARLETLAARLSDLEIGIAKEDLELAARAAAVCKLDLATRMIAEHPELEGIMAAHYFAGKDARLRKLVAGHRNASLDRRKDNDAHWALVLITEFERLAGLLMAGERLSGSRDPHGLRKSAARLAALLADRPQLELRKLIAPLLDVMRASISNATEDVDTRIVELLLDRVRNQPRAILGLMRTPPTEVINAVVDAQDMRIQIGQYAARIGSFAEFIASPQGSILVTAHKRVANILRKSEAPAAKPVDLVEPAELALERAVLSTESAIANAAAKGDYAGALALLAALAAPVAQFFDDVLVNCEDQSLRSTRLWLLTQLLGLFNSVAPLARL